jgi:predicted aldo/keto reductase-like oxidoreductase
MKYRSFGTTGLKISEIIFGGGVVGGILINADDYTRRQAIRMALDGGINWVDSATAAATTRTCSPEKPRPPSTSSSSIQPGR